jgi:acetyl esterase/lipase
MLKPIVGPPLMTTSHIQRKWLDIPYANQSPTQKLDIYLPDEGNGPFPLIVSIHGGGFMFGDKADVMNLSMMQGRSRGYAVACINYRMSHEAIWPAQIFDCKAAIRFLRANAFQYKIDPDRIAAWGPSAGGHLCAMLGTSHWVKELEDPSMGNPGVSTRVQVVVDWYGPVGNFIDMDKQFRESGLGRPDHSKPDSPESRLLGTAITEVPDLVAKASPMTYITPVVPYFLIQHGSIDQSVPLQQSQIFVARLEQVAGKEKVIFEIKRGLCHADPGFETEDNVDHILDFIDEHLKK